MVYFAFEIAESLRVRNIKTISQWQQRLTFLGLGEQSPEAEGLRERPLVSNSLLASFNSEITVECGRRGVVVLLTMYCCLLVFLFPSSSGLLPSSLASILLSPLTLVSSGAEGISLLPL